ncbi:P-loop NTPase, partial [Bartonella sp. MU70NMGDW]
GARAEAERREVPFLAEIPLDAALRFSSDEGIPIFVAKSSEEHAKLYRKIVDQIKNQLF